MSLPFRKLPAHLSSCPPPMQAMETSSTENNEINLYDDLLKFNDMSPEERVTVAQALSAEPQSDEQPVAVSISSTESTEVSTNESQAFNVRVSGPLNDTASFGAPAAESNDMIFTLSDEAQTRDFSAANQANEFLLSYQDQSPVEETKEDFPGFNEAPQIVQQAVIKEKIEPTDSVPHQEPQPDPVKPVEVAAPILAATPEEKTHLSEVSEIVAVKDAKDNVAETTQVSAPKVADKQGVRITVREETAGSVTLSVADIMGDDDFEDEVDESPFNTDHQSSPPVKSGEISSNVISAEASDSQPETASLASEPVIESDLFEVTGSLVESSIELQVEEEVFSIAGPVVSQSLDQSTEMPTEVEESIKAFESPDQSASDSGDEFLKGSKPLKITGFLNLENKPDNADEPEEITCPACGHISKSTDLLCLGCGAFFDDQEVQVESEPVCADCGETVASDEVFCPTCGSILLAH